MYFSIILPTYNRSNLISRAIDSVLAQKFVDWELIVVDDGSTDLTIQFLNENYIDDRIKLCQIAHGGPGRARNFGINIAKGQWLCFLDSDDYYLSNHLEVLHREIESNRGRDTLFYTGSFVEKDEHISVLPIYTGKQTLMNFIKKEFLMINSICIPKQIVATFSFSERYRTWEDLHLWIRLLTVLDFRQVPQYTTVVVNHDERSHLMMLANREFSLFAERISCIKDLFNNEIIKYDNEIYKYEVDFVTYEYTRWFNRFNNSGKRDFALRILILGLRDFIIYKHFVQWLKLLIKWFFRKPWPFNRIN